MALFDVIFKGDLIKYKLYLDLVKLQESFYTNYNLIEIYENKLENFRINMESTFNRKVSFSYGTSHGILGVILTLRPRTLITTTWEHDSVISPVNGIFLEPIYNNDSAKVIFIVPLIDEKNETVYLDADSLDIVEKCIEELGDPSSAMFLYSSTTYNYGVFLYKVINKEFNLKNKLQSILKLSDDAHSFWNMSYDKYKNILVDFNIFDLYKWFPGIPGQGIVLARNYITFFYHIYHAIPPKILKRKLKKTTWYSTDIPSWQYNPVLVRWIYNTILYERIKDSHKTIISRNIELAKLFDDLLYDYKLDNYFLILGDFAIRALIPKREKLAYTLWRYLYHRGIYTHYIAKKIYRDLNGKSFQIRYPAAVRLCFHSLLIEENNVYELCKLIKDFVNNKIIE